MKSKCRLADAGRFNRQLPEHLRLKLLFCFISVAVLCTCAIAQEETAEYWFEKSGELLDNRSLDEADQALDKALQLEPENSSIWLSKALVLELLSKVNESQAAYGKALYLTDEDLQKIVKTGDKVLFGKYSGTEIELEGEKLLILSKSDILAIVE